MAQQRTDERQLTLQQFRVTGFRSVDDSGTVEVDGVTALIGTNESGKTNLLLPLWKMNPAKEGAVQPTADYPRKHYNTLRTQKPQPVFIEAIFTASDAFARELAKATGLSSDRFQRIAVSRRFTGKPEIDFPDAKPPRTLPGARIVSVLRDANHEVEGLAALDGEVEMKRAAMAAITKSIKASEGSTAIDGPGINLIADEIGDLLPDTPEQTSTLVPRLTRLQNDLGALSKEIATANPRENPEVAKMVEKALPKFVYYSNYGNLDSEIYLPHVIENLKRQDLGAKEQAKVRTLKVLFEFVNLEPAEILELGRDFKDPANPARQPTPEEIGAIAEKKKQRSILLQSASSLLTSKFRDWWKQGDYRFRFEADGDHFRIWVSDDRRPEEIELEGRSTGLQWFLSFYLVFLVESQDSHNGAVLLLDEPGLSLHPLAQRDLSDFFDGLASSNQIVYTTHSPFLVDADRLDRARKVYVAADGTSKVTSDLRGGDDDPRQKGAAYAVHAAVGLSVAESLLLGCTPVVVEGPSDQHYLTAIKTILIAAGRLSPGRELVFPSAGGAKGVKAVAAILGGRDALLPVVLLDSDNAGRASGASLKQSLYSAEPEKILEIGTFTGIADSEVEDLIPTDIIAREVDRLFRPDGDAFSDVLKGGTALVPQVEAWAAKHHVKLELGWKVQLAKRVKQSILSRGVSGVPGPVLEIWVKLFADLQTPSA